MKSVRNYPHLRTLQGKSNACYIKNYASFNHFGKRRKNLKSLNPIHHQICLFIKSKKIFVSSPYSKGHVSYRRFFEFMKAPFILIRHPMGIIFRICAWSVEVHEETYHDSSMRFTYLSLSTVVLNSRHCQGKL